jgi:hypothetical protein
MDVDDVVLQALQVFIAKAEALQAVHADIGEEDVGLLHKAAQRLKAFRILEIEQDGALVAVAAHVDGAHAGRRRRAGVAHDVARAVFNLYDVGAHVAHQLRGVGAEHDSGQVQDLHARKRAGRRAGQAHSLRSSLWLAIGRRGGRRKGGSPWSRRLDGCGAQATGLAGFRL